MPRPGRADAHLAVLHHQETGATAAVSPHSGVLQGLGATAGTGPGLIHAGLAVNFPAGRHHPSGYGPRGLLVAVASPISLSR